ncbi:hypothetical protein BH23PAT1_BH23PAT1_4460 [soil metagenome]
MKGHLAVDELSERRLAENEVIFREANKSALEFVKELDYPKDAELRFFCECARADCRERIVMAAREYNDLHQNDRQFVIRPGHNFPEIEKVIKEENGRNVVEKHIDPPSPDKLNSVLKNLNT